MNVDSKEQCSECKIWLPSYVHPDSDDNELVYYTSTVDGKKDGPRLVCLECIPKV